MRTFKKNNFFCRFFLLFFYCNGDKNETVNEKSWSDILLDKEEATNYVEQKHLSDINLSLADAFTFGIYGVTKNLTLRLLTNYTNLIVSHEDLNEYALIQKEKLYIFLKEMENTKLNKNMPISTSENIIRDIEKRN